MIVLEIIGCIVGVAAAFMFITLGISVLINTIDSHEDRKYR